MDRRRGQVDGPWIPACAGMTGNIGMIDGFCSMDFRVRGNDPM
ncbi:MAG: hypothetical protein AB7I68_08595 [Porticoccaceae bacterium]